MAEKEFPIGSIVRVWAINDNDAIFKEPPVYGVVRHDPTMDGLGWAFCAYVFNPPHPLVDHTNGGQIGWYFQHHEGEVIPENQVPDEVWVMAAQAALNG